MPVIYEIFGSDAHEMTKALMERAGVAGQIPTGASVALKPNLVVAATPESGATTHAGVLSGAIEYLRDHGVTGYQHHRGLLGGRRYRAGLPDRRLRRR